MSIRNLRRLKYTILIISILVYFTSLTQPAFTFNDLDGQNTHSSISLLLMGGFVIAGGGLLEWIIWLANPLYFIGLFRLFKDNRSSKYFSVLACILAISFSTWKEILASESGRTATIEKLNSGYWLWICSLILLSIGTLYYFRQIPTNEAK